MKIRLKEKFIMRDRVQRDVLSMKVNYFQDKMCAPPSNKYPAQSISLHERASLCTLKKGSLTVEAALLMPFLLMIFIAFFSFFSQYASAAELKAKAAAEAKKAAISLGSMGQTDTGDVTIYKTAKQKEFWIDPFWKESQITQNAVCRAWIGFTELEETETYVYITPNGNVYHLYSDCTHLKLSIRSASMAAVNKLKNDFGQNSRKCEICEEPFGTLVYITSEGDCYHSERTCSGLKRTIRQVPFSEAAGRSACVRCMSREE